MAWSDLSMASVTDNQPRYYLRALVAFCSLGLSIYFVQLSLFNVWLTALENKPLHNPLFEFRSWLFAMFSMVLIGFFMWLTRDTIQRLNTAETRE
jgi:hypothetical protein